RHRRIERLIGRNLNLLVIGQPRRWHDAYFGEQHSHEHEVVATALDLEMQTGPDHELVELRIACRVPDPRIRPQLSERLRTIPLTARRHKPWANGLEYIFSVGPDVVVPNKERFIFVPPSVVSAKPAYCVANCFPRIGWIARVALR